MKDIVFVIDITHPGIVSLETSFIERMIEKLKENEPYSRVGLVAYSNRALPLVDLCYDKTLVVKTLKEIPILQSTPKPETGLYEAIDMLYELDDKLCMKKHILLWYRLMIKPGKQFFELVDLASIEGIKIYLFTPFKRRPKWLENSNLKVIYLAESKPSRNKSMDRIIDEIIEEG